MMERMTVANLAEVLAEMKVRMMDCLSAVMKDEMMVKTTDCLLDANLAEQMADKKVSMLGC